MADRPNILMLIVDCLRADRVFGRDRGCRTPCLDELRRRGVSFTQCIATTTTTTPSVTALLTGQLPGFNGVRAHSGYKLNPATRTLAEYLKQAGYRTVARVTGPLTLEVGLDRGFDDYQWRTRKQYVLGPWTEQLLADVTALARGTQAGQAPWFLCLHVFELHGPRQIAPGFNRREFGRNWYERSLSSIDPVLQRVIDAAGSNTTVFLTGDHGETLLPSAAQDRIHELLKPIRKPIRRQLFKWLYRDLLSSALYETGHGWHVHDDQIRVPLVCAGPGFPPSTEIDKQVRHVDLMPTILQVAGADHDAISINGRSLFPLIGGEETGHRPAYCEAVGTAFPDSKGWVVALRKPKYKYCYRPFAPKPLEELFDLEADPNERRNLARNNPGLCAEMRSELQAMNQEFEAQPILRGQRMTAEEQQVLEERLKDLGYIE